MLAGGIRFGFAKDSVGIRSGFAPSPGIRSCGGCRILWEKHTWSPRLPQPIFAFIILKGVIMSVGGGCCFGGAPGCGLKLLLEFYGPSSRTHPLTCQGCVLLEFSGPAPSAKNATRSEEKNAPQGCAFWSALNYHEHCTVLVVIHGRSIFHVFSWGPCSYSLAASHPPTPSCQRPM